MAYPSTHLIDVLRQTAERMATGVQYQWTHMGHCNCGHLAQTLTGLGHAQLHAWGLEKYGDWSDKAAQYATEFADDATTGTCPSGYPIDGVIFQMLEAGLTLNDITALERLSDRAVLLRLPLEQRALDYRKRADVVLYLRTWADQLEEQLTERAVQELVQVRSPVLV